MTCCPGANAFDEGYSIPSEFAQTLSVRTQQIIGLESGLANVVDPFGGSNPRFDALLETTVLSSYPEVP
mgnify:CR=1 FL=1